MERLMRYTMPLTLALYLASFAVAMVAFLLASATGSNVVLALGFSASLLMSWPLIRDLVPVFWWVVIRGSWPTRNT